MNIPSLPNQPRFSVSRNVAETVAAHTQAEAAQSLIFVFGSNLRGAHGAGAAAYAHSTYGARMGEGIGLTGKAYAIPTKNENIRTMLLGNIYPHVLEFKRFAILNPELMFKVTRIGCGLAGYRDSDIAPMFRGSPLNCSFDTNWHAVLGDEYNYWGHIA